jgi:hypothetical protein
MIILLNLKDLFECLYLLSSQKKKKKIERKEKKHKNLATPFEYYLLQVQRLYFNSLVLCCREGVLKMDNEE